MVCQQRLVCVCEMFNTRPVVMLLYHSTALEGDVSPVLIRYYPPVL